MHLRTCKDACVVSDYSPLKGVSNLVMKAWRNRREVTRALIRKLSKTPALHLLPFLGACLPPSSWFPGFKYGLTVSVASFHKPCHSAT